MHQRSTLYFFKRSGDHPYLHSFPTRRSSDLERVGLTAGAIERQHQLARESFAERVRREVLLQLGDELGALPQREDRKSTRLNSSHVEISYAVFCLKKKKNHDAKNSTCEYMLW